MPLPKFRIALIAWILIAVPFQAWAGTRVVTLGTGTPVPDPDRAGSAIAVVTGGEAYIFDAGGGMVQRAVEASARHEMPELVPQSIRYLFITHLHSDHIHDMAELATARWWAREQRLHVFGPHGTAAYIEHMNAMSQVEADIRLAGTPPELVIDRRGYRAEVTEIDDGIVFENEHVSIEAFTVDHGDIRPAFAYRIETADRTIVISGDTTYSEALIEKASGVDLLFHEAVSGDYLGEMSEFWQHYHGTSHTTTDQIAEIGKRARPGLLVLYHVLFLGASPEELVREVTRSYDGPVVLANDLDVF
jgi:ribonuclease Z